MIKEEWQVGVAVAVVGLAVLACKGSKSGDAVDAAPTVAVASATADPVASDQPDTSVAAKPVPKAAAICKAGIKARTFEGVDSCIKECKKDSDCENPGCANNLCMSDDEEPTLAQSNAASAKASAGTPARGAPGPTVDQVTIVDAQGKALQTCPKGWSQLPGGQQCNRPCKADADCHGSNKCQVFMGDHFCDNKKWD